MNYENGSNIELTCVASDRSFGLVFSTVFAIIAFLPLRFDGAIRFEWLAAAVILLIISVVRPSLLSVPNKVWASFGALLHRIVSPVVLGILFFVVIVPFGVVMKMFRKDPLQLRKEPEFESYWVKREFRPVNKKSMSNQF